MSVLAWRRVAWAACAAAMLLAPSVAQSVETRSTDLAAVFQTPPASAKPWVFWYWMNAAVSRAGITTDLTAMKDAGLGGAYLMPIRGAANPPYVTPSVEQLSPLWWEHLRFAFQEADRLGLKLAMQDCDGFATAGGPWITPAQSMQRLVWTETYVDGGKKIQIKVPAPDRKENFYRDVAVLAFPAPTDGGVSSRTITPVVTTSIPGKVAQFLANPASTETFQSNIACWIQYAFPEPFTCRAITISLPPAANAYQPNTYQANRFAVEVSDDGEHFRRVAQLQPPRHGWQDGDADVTHAIPEVRARFFRLVFDPAGSEPGAEDLDSAKWKPVLKVRAIELGSEARLHAFEGKSGAAWRIAPPTTAEQIPAATCVPLAQIVDLTGKVGAGGELNWDAPAGKWTILRFGHTSTGHRNDTGGGGRGLECDKFDPSAVRFQFEHWFGEIVRQVGPELTRRVLTKFHVDSWECGSQNWSTVFRNEFRRRRGYDLLPYLPAMAGIPVESAPTSERFLHDVRTTIAELLNENFFGTMATLAHAHGCEFTAESVAPTMVSDGMAHFAQADVPMGEFWLRSPTHDKLNDMLDAISGARVYGRPVIQAEAFTEVALAWDESPRMLKTLQDRNYCLGANRFVFHVFAHNPWPERRPGMTLSGVGLFFQPNQTWWKPGRAWVDYTSRSQALLQQGRAVADIAVFTGEEIPRRAVVPWKLQPTLPGIVPRVADIMAGRKLPQIVDAADWSDPLRGYAYDSINPDALLRLAQVRNGRIELPGGSSYRMLIVPSRTSPEVGPVTLSPAVVSRLQEFAAAGVVILLGERPLSGAEVLWPDATDGEGRTHPSGAGRVVTGPWRGSDFEALGLSPDVVVRESETKGPKLRSQGFAWTHRQADDWDVYLLSNQRDTARDLTVSLRVSGRVPELWDAVTGTTGPAPSWQQQDGRTLIPIHFAGAGSVFVVFRTPTKQEGRLGSIAGAELPVTQTLAGPWRVSFATDHAGPAQPTAFASLESWTARTEPGLKNYSGTAVYTRHFTWPTGLGKSAHVWLDLGAVCDLAEVSLNGVPCGVAWTAPFRVDVTQALRKGDNELAVSVTNTWFNRIAGDRGQPVPDRLTWTIAPDRTEGKPLLEAGLLGPVTLRTESSSYSAAPSAKSP